MGGKPCCETKLISNKDLSDQDVAALVFKSVPTDAVEQKVFHSLHTTYPAEKLLTPEKYAPPPLFILPFYITMRVIRI